MFDIGWTELLLIGVVSLIVIGPKDLPVMFHTLGRLTARARGMAREFSSAMEDAAKASGVHEATRELRDLQKLASPRALGLDALSRAADKFERWDPLVPIRDAAAGAVPDPSAPVPDPSAPAPAAPSTAHPAQPVAAVPPVPTRVVAQGQPAEAPSGLGLGPTAASSPAPGAPAASDPEHRPGARRLHAVRRTDRS